jgi:hypothetical protein
MSLAEGLVVGMLLETGDREAPAAGKKLAARK